ncbi:hypothetical protein MTBBW1_1680014 [Desulfamplus magnetovallimortis]|uniref:Uncharacterized protein n=1 Tax=Desulfamplus magnetovallimortis TaxID=1246637 RepID=A0A1W1H9G8_9BACT|nr:hypothetical protein MTBBW1_1680014 [Desulfamplus magnetovallimortis]
MTGSFSLLQPVKEKNMEMVIEEIIIDSINDFRVNFMLFSFFLGNRYKVL